MPLSSPAHPLTRTCVFSLPRQRRRETVPGQVARAPARLAAHPVPRPWMLPADPCYPRSNTSTRVSSISLLRPPVACAADAVPGEPGVSRHLARRSEPARLPREAFPPPSSSVRTDLRAPLSRSPSGPPAPARRAGLPVRVGGRHPWREPRSLPPPIREDRRLPRSGAPSAVEHPSRVFDGADDFAVTALSLAVPFSPATDRWG